MLEECRTPPEHRNHVKGVQGQVSASGWLELLCLSKTRYTNGFRNHPKHNCEVIYLKPDISEGDRGPSINLRADNFFLICFGSFCILIRTCNTSPLYRKLQELPGVKILRHLLYQADGEQDSKTHSLPLTGKVQGILSDASGCYETPETHLWKWNLQPRWKKTKKAEHKACRDWLKNLRKARESLEPPVWSSHSINP